MNKLLDKELQELFDCLHFMNMKELRAFCNQYDIPTKENKVLLIEKIMHFIKTGAVLEVKKLPTISKAQKGHAYPLEEKTVILSGAFKNDLKTRNYFQQLIGSHFHFTAYGIDWINERWHEGNPPTYKEFAHMWQQEFQKRKITKVQPKKEWALLTFVQRYQQENPHSNKAEVVAAWKQERIKQVTRAIQLLKKALL